jgi:VCBS repeat-containing protein
VQAVTVTLTGTNDPTFTFTFFHTLVLTEQAGATGSTTGDLADGTINFVDADFTDTHKVVSVVPQGAGYLGSFTLGALTDTTGATTEIFPWGPVVVRPAGTVPVSFSVPDGALDFLAAGQTLVQSYAVTIDDFHNGPATQIVPVTLIGTNDPTVITSTAAAASGSMTDLAGAPGRTVPAVATGTLTFTDADLIDTHTASFVAQGAGNFGIFRLGALADCTDGVTGSVPWSYSADGTLIFLAAGQTRVQKYDVTVDDGHGGAAVQTVTVTLTGSNDLPVITSTVAAATGSVTELAGVTGGAAVDTASGTLTFRDVDFIDTHTATVVAQGSNYLGVLTLGPLTDSRFGATGSVGWNFSVADGALDFLAAGQMLVQKYNVTVADNHGGTVTQIVTVTLTGTNDPTVIVGAALANSVIYLVPELAGVTGSAAVDTASGMIAFTDVDLTDTHRVVSVVPQGAGYLGSLTLGTLADSTGGVTGSIHWTFSVVDGALDFLAAGQTVVQSYAVTIGDFHNGPATQFVTVMLTGTNDPTVIVAAATMASGAVTEQAGVTGSTVTDLATGTIAFTDADLTDTHRLVSVVPRGAAYLGSFTLGTLADSTGGVSGSIHWTFSVVDGALDFLAAGQKLIQSYAVTIGDFHNGPATQIVTMTLTGTNDAPVANPDVLTPAQAQGNLWTTLLANDTDIDTAHNLLTITAVNTTGMFGTVSLNAAGHSLLYTAPAVAGPDTFQYTISDGLGGTSSSTVTVNPDHLVTDNWVVSQGQTAIFSSASVLANDSAFNGGALTLFSVSGPHVTWDGTNITYTAPAVGPSDSFTYTTTDSVGRHATGTVNVSLWDGSSTPVGSAANQAEWLVGRGSAPITMIGSAGADHLQGSVGDDIITGGGGADTLTGGGGFNHFVYKNAGTIGAGASSSDSNLAAMDHITDFVSGGDIIEVNGFGFSAARTAAVTAINVKAFPFTSSDVVGYFADGNAVHVEKQTSTVSAQVYIDTNNDGSFEAAKDIVIHLDHSNGVTILDFQFH